MKWGMAVLVVGALVGTLAGCSEQSSSPAVDDAELNRLVQRTLDLREAVTAAGRMTPELRRELSVLTQDVNSWQARTGRTDISVSSSRHTREGSTVATAPTGDEPTGCTPCPLIRNMFGKVCFLIDEGPCKDEFIAKVCGYICLDLPPTTAITVKPKTVTGTLTLLKP